MKIVEHQYIVAYILCPFGEEFHLYLQIGEINEFLKNHNSVNDYKHVPKNIHSCYCIRNE